MSVVTGTDVVFSPGWHAHSITGDVDQQAMRAGRNVNSTPLHSMNRREFQKCCQEQLNRIIRGYLCTVQILLSYH